MILWIIIFSYSPKNFFLHLEETLEKIEYSQSTHDPCLFYKGSTICLVYVDNCLFYSTARATINADLDLLKQQSLDFNIEDSVAGFLGVHLHRNEETGAIHMTQVSLIDRILAALDLEDCNPNATPAPTDPLPKDAEGDTFNGTYNYPSVLGMLSPLCNNTRSDIAFAVHKFTRFTHHPIELHAKYLQHIGKYLKGTRTFGTILQPDNSSSTFKIDCYCDADFVGLYKTENRADPHCVKSPTGYVICVNNCPITWGSKLQTSIALSTM